MACERMRALGRLVKRNTLLLTAIWIATCVTLELYIKRNSDPDNAVRPMMTGVHDTITTNWPNAAVVNVMPLSKVLMNDKQHTVSVCSGEILVDVLSGPFVVEMPLALATVAAQGKLRVMVNPTGVALEVLAGEALLQPGGGNSSKPWVTLKKGEAYRVPRVVMASFLVQHHEAST